MTTRFLVLEWRGSDRGWCIPDHHHGSVNPGPYATKEEAYSAISAYAEKRFDEWSRDGNLETGRYFRELALFRHAVAPVEWPDDPIDI